MSVTLPPESGVQEQLPAPAASVAVQPPPDPSEMTTVPVGIPAAGATAATDTATVVGYPTTNGEGEIDAIVVVVFPFAVRLAPLVLGAWTALPPYEAVTVLAAFVEGVSVTLQADVVAVTGEGLQVGAENVSPATLDEKVTRPPGLDIVPAGSASATVAVTEVGERTVAGFGENITPVVVARAATVIVMDWLEVSGVGLPSVAVTVKVKEPDPEGVPERSPPDARVRPVGRVPVDVQATAPLPPTDVNA